MDDAGRTTQAPLITAPSGPEVDPDEESADAVTDNGTMSSSRASTGSSRSGADDRAGANGKPASDPAAKAEKASDNGSGTSVPLPADTVGKSTGGTSGKPKAAGADAAADGNDGKEQDKDSGRQGGRKPMTSGNGAWFAGARRPRSPLNRRTRPRPRKTAPRPPRTTASRPSHRLLPRRLLLHRPLPHRPLPHRPLLRRSRAGPARPRHRGQPRRRHRPGHLRVVSAGATAARPGATSGYQSRANPGTGFTRARVRAQARARVPDTRVPPTRRPRARRPATRDRRGRPGGTRR